MEILAAVHKVADAALALRIVFAFCLAGVFLGGVYVIRKRKELFGSDPNVVADNWASRNLRFWQVLLVWILAMELLITMLFRV